MWITLWIDQGAGGIDLGGRWGRLIGSDRGEDGSVGEVDVISNLLAISYATTGMVSVSIDYQPLYAKML